MNNLSFKQLFISAIFCACAIFVNADIPANYYNNAEGLKGAALKSSLSQIIDGHTSKGYDGLYDIYEDSDNLNGKVWDMYSTCSWNHGSKVCGNYKNVCDCYNREHSIPQSWFGGSESGTMKSDAHHVIPSDGKVNGQRSNNPHGETNNGNSLGSNALGVSGTSSVPGYSGTVFEPDDQYKGDFARMYFYFVTRYQTSMPNIGDTRAFQQNTYPSLQPWFQTLMLKWHRQDPVSQKEIDRNDGVYRHQHNRNPFIDYPSLAEHIWGNKMNDNWSSNPIPEGPHISEPNDGMSVECSETPVNTTISEMITVKGGLLTGNLSVAISGTNAANFTTTNTTLTQASVESDNGAIITVRFTPTSLNNHTANLTISGGGLPDNVTITLTGKGTNDFKAVDASNFTESSFKANWSNDFGANSYILNVFSYASNGAVQDITLFTTSFSNESFNDGVTKNSGYSAFEQNTLRMGSGNNGCEIELPALDLSSDSVILTVNAKQYNNDADAKLYVEVNGTAKGEITTDGQMKAHSIIIGGGSQNSVITLSVNKSKRVFLQDITIKDRGEAISEIPLNGYPFNVGNNTTHTVTVPNFDETYYYNVTSVGGSNAKSNTIKVVYTPTTDNNNNIEENIIAYYNGSQIIIDGINDNSTINLYSINGSLIKSMNANSSTSIDMNNCAKGLYFLKIFNNTSSQSMKIIVK